jgi:DNA-binding MarR family transcriptional regulator
MATRKSAPPPANTTIDTSLVERFIGYSTRRASLAIVERFMVHMAPYQLRPVTFTLLTLIAGNPGILSSQLCALLHIQSSNLVALVKQLRDRGLIERQPHPNDVRAFGLYLTPTGRDFFAQAQAAALASGLEATAGLSDAERETLAQLLRKIYQ